MNNLKLGSLLVGLVCSSSLYAYGTGYSSFPLQEKQSVVSGEFTGVTSTGGGVGVQGRFTTQSTQRLKLDAGIGFSGGERTGRAFIGADIEIFPDYQRQPRVSVKTTLESSKEYGNSRNNISLAPIISKGLSFSGKEAFPYISLPLHLSLDSDTNTFSTGLSASVGVNGFIPVEGFNHLIGSLEANVGINDSYTGVFAGLTYPIN